MEFEEKAVNWKKEFCEARLNVHRVMSQAVTHSENGEFKFNPEKITMKELGELKNAGDAFKQFEKEGFPNIRTKKALTALSNSARRLDDIRSRKKVDQKLVSQAMNSITQLHTLVQQKRASGSVKIKKAA